MNDELRCRNRMDHPNGTETTYSYEHAGRLRLWMEQRGEGEMYLTLRYNSLKPQDGLAGWGWISDYMDYITVNPDGTLLLTLPDGTQWLFVPVGQFSPFLSSNGCGDGFAMSPYMGDRMRINVDSVKLDGSMGVIQRIDKDGTRTRYERFGQKLLPTLLADRNGNTQTYTRDASGVLTQVTDSHGRTLTMTYTAGKLGSVTDNAGQTTSYSYDFASGNMTGVTDVNGDKTSYGYDASHRMTSVVDGLPPNDEYQASPDD